VSKTLRNETVDAHAACQDGLCRLVGRGLTIVVSFACLLVVTACAESVVGVAHQSKAAIRALTGNEEIVLQPKLQAGEGGWCLTTVIEGGCPTLNARTERGPIVIEVWKSRNAPSANEGVNEGIVLTTSRVAAVSLEDYGPIATRAESGLPDHLRVAVIELRGRLVTSLLGAKIPLPPPRSRFIALTSKGESILRVRTMGSLLEFEVPSRHWGHEQSAPLGVCTLDAKGLSGLVVEGGRVMVAVEPHPDLLGREFVSCVSTSYLLDNWPIKASVLLDAARPGARPGQLAAMRPLAGHQGVVQGQSLEGDAVARRIPGAWLIVSKGNGLGQRLTLLEHLRVTIHL
jgi:hypothetical protein